jgi:GIY-YIG catalytic domain
MTYRIYYLFCQPTRKGYVGRTKHHINCRFGEYFRDAFDPRSRNSDMLLSAALRQYSTLSDWSLRELATCDTMQDAIRLEIEFIDDFKTLAPGGYNQVCGQKACPETRRRFRERGRKRWRGLSPQTQRRIIAAATASRTSKQRSISMKRYHTALRRDPRQLSFLPP